MVTPSENPRCFNADGTRATREVFITLAEDCSDGGGGDSGFNGNPPDSNNGGNNNGSSGGGDINGYGIFIPNLYNGEADPNNVEFVLAGQIATYFNALPQNIKSLTNSNQWVYAYLKEYFKNNGNAVNARNTPKATAALNNYYNFQLNSYSPSVSFVAHERLNFWAYYTFLNNNPANVNTQSIFNIRDYIIQAAQNDESIVDYLFNNYQYPEAIDFVKALIAYLNQNTTNNITNPEALDFVEYSIKVLEANPSANPLLGADCRSFEYAQPPGATRKGCAVTNFNHTFYTAGFFFKWKPLLW
ncbi:MAG: hypothetical protein HC854_16500 [Flavobacterium sp.]|nr:hypothetical protein [Flavobacterium sp.]